MEKKKGFCSRCKKTRILERERVNHILHLLLSIITMGFWVIMWIMITIRHDMWWYCFDCGKKMSSVGFLNKKVF